jgi:hypothetical protein
MENAILASTRVAVHDGDDQVALEVLRGMEVVRVTAAEKVETGRTPQRDHRVPSLRETGERERADA